MPKWFYRIRGREFGPLPSERIRQLAASGRLKPADYVRKGSAAPWKRACQVRGLSFGYAPSPGDAARRWYCKTAQGVSGPFSAVEIVRQGLAGEISPTDLLRSASSRAWAPAARFRGMRFAPAETPLPEQEQEQEQEQEMLSSSPVQVHPPPEPDGPTSLPLPNDPPKRASRLRDWIAAAQPTASGFLILLITIVPCVLPVFGGGPTAWSIACLSVLGVVLGAGAYILRGPPTRTELNWAGAAFLFTLIFGATTLLQFTELAVAAAASDASWQDNPLWLVKGVGAAYETAVAAPREDAGLADFAQILGGNLASVGLCEECLKLLPVVVALASGYLVSRRGIVFLGAMSGLAFGTAEGLWILLDGSAEMTPPFSMAIMRLIGCPMGHAALTALGARLLFLLAASSHGKGVWRTALLGLLVALVMAVPHSFYNTFLALGMPGFAGLTMTAVVFLVINASDSGGERAAERKLAEPKPL
jgi:RsiW-degrading membrane proteinase PrsW (M82 family)